MSLSWSAPVNIDGSGYFTSVSCASSSFCMAVGDYGNAIVGKELIDGV
jgi:hypothetical protein